MISADSTFFPYNAIDILVPRLQTIDADLFICKRPLRESDPNQSIGVYGNQWVPDTETLEMRGRYSAQEPTLGKYYISIQCFIKDMDEERGAATHATLAKRVRAMLYRNSSLNVALHSLTATVEGSTERTKTFGISTQRYLSNELNGSWLYLSQIESWLETETS